MNTSTRLSTSPNVNLAFMECFASCVMTYIRYTGGDYKRILLDYWNLGYQFRTLMSSKDARKFALDQLFDVEMEFYEGSPGTLEEQIQLGNSAIVLCSASRLDYFPQEYLSMEASGFQHSVLIHDIDPDRGYALFDPTVDHIGFIAIKSMAFAGMTGRGDSIQYFILKRNSSLRPLGERESLAFCSQRNLDFYVGRPELVQELKEAENQQINEKKRLLMEWFSSRRSGSQSLELFAGDVRRCLEWPESKRSSWLKSNSLMTSSIRQLRQRIWEAYREKMEPDEETFAEGDDKIHEISGQWQRLNYLLLKMNSASDKSKFAEQIDDKLEEIGRTEVQFLTWLKQKVSL